MVGFSKCQSSIAIFKWFHLAWPMFRVFSSGLPADEYRNNVKQNCHLPHSLSLSSAHRTYTKKNLYVRELCQILHIIKYLVHSENNHHFADAKQNDRKQCPVRLDSAIHFFHIYRTPFRQRNKSGGIRKADHWQLGKIEWKTKQMEYVCTQTAKWKKKQQQQQPKKNW